MSDSSTDAPGEWAEPDPGLDKLIRFARLLVANPGRWRSVDRSEFGDTADHWGRLLVQAYPDVPWFFNEEDGGHRSACVAPLEPSADSAAKASRFDDAACIDAFGGRLEKMFKGSPDSVRSLSDLAREALRELRDAVVGQMLDPKR